MQNQPETNFNFLENISHKKHVPGQLYYIVRYLVTQPKKIIKFSAYVLGAAFLLQIPHYGYQAFSTLEKQNQVKEAENLKKDMNLYNVQIDMIKKMTQSDIDSIIAYIRKMQKINNLRINETYWKIKYLSETSHRYSIEKEAKNLSAINTKMNQYYDYRASELNLTYQMIQSGLTTVPPLHDGENAALVLLYWHNFTKTNSIASYPDLDTYINGWDEDFTDKAAINKYLENNKALINKGNALSSYATIN